jgi:GR25 family glycosyltransferase involved in LPS biosynthesis
MIPKIIVISLKRAKERRERIKSQLSSLELDAIIMDAVDGQKLSEEEKNKFLHLPGGYREGDKFKPGEIACTMSHINALKIAKENNWGSVIILEDDVILAEDFERRIKFLFKILPDDWEHVYISGVPRTAMNAIPFHAMLQLANIIPSPVVDCIPGTIIRKSAYDKIIDYLSKFETTTDDSIIHMIHEFKNLKSYTYFPFCVYVEDDYTYIWDENLNREHKSKQYFKNKL